VRVFLPASVQTSGKSTELRNVHFEPTVQYMRRLFPAGPEALKEVKKCVVFSASKINSYKMYRNEATSVRFEPKASRGIFLLTYLSCRIFEE
jgi:hypothetical protein